MKLRLVGGVDRDDWTKQHSVPTHAARDKDAARLLDAPGAVQPAKSPPPSTLSERELDVVRLVTGGRSNREIAEELVISRKTAEAHVSHILTKLGLWRRVQIATWSLQHGVGLAEAH